MDAGDEPTWNLCQPEQYDEILEAHVRRVRDQFAMYLGGGKELDVYPSAKEGFRLRVKFLVYGNIGEGGDSDDEGDVEEGTKELQHAGWHNGERYGVDECRIAAPIIQDAMKKVISYVGNCKPLRYNLRGLNYLSTMSGDLLITMIYERRNLGSTWQKHAHLLRNSTGIDIVAYTKGTQRLIGDREHVNETLHDPDGNPVHYKQIAGNFSNPNGIMAMHTLKWLKLCCEDINAKETDLLELYCGVGSHTVAMAKYFRRVLGVEINRKLVAAAHTNLRLNNAANAWVLRAPSEKFCSSMLRHSTWKLNLPSYRKDIDDTSPEMTAFSALQDTILTPAEAEVNTANFTFGAVIVDPPRAGLDPVTCQLVSRYPSIAYISCNPDALHRDLEALSKTHYVARMAVFDHFPYTGHLECGALLRRRRES